MNFLQSCCLKRIDSEVRIPISYVCQDQERFASSPRRGLRLSAVTGVDESRPRFFFAPSPWPVDPALFLEAPERLIWSTARSD